MTRNNKNSLLRKRGVAGRSLLKSLAVGTVAITIAITFLNILVCGDAHSARTIVVRDPGGPISESYRAGYYNDFTKETGIEIKAVTSQHEPVSQIKAIVESNSKLWDMAFVPKYSALAAAQGGYLEELGNEVFNDPNVKAVQDQFKTPHIIGNAAYATVLVYRTDAFPPNKAPNSWRDFWDVKRFPGRRAMRKTPNDSIEMALFADGVPPDKIYPCDFDRAFRSLDKIKPHITVWWTGGAQSAQLLESKEVALLPMWSTRVAPVIDSGVPAAIVWNQGLYTYEGLVILKGGDNIDACKEFIKFVARPKAQAKATLLSPLGPTNPEAYQYLEPKRVRQSAGNPDNMAKMIPIDEAFWAANRDKAIERFNAWLLK
jgi:putative spermidine/putrescine transport system substrate-binding protein